MKTSAPVTPRQILISLATAALLCTMALTALAAGYSYVEPADFKKWLESGKTMKIVDIQTHDDFVSHHFTGSLETNAFPGKSSEDKKKLEKMLPRLTGGSEEIVVVCPRGGGGAKNTVDYLRENGIAEKRLIILKGGMQGWPYRELTVKGPK